MLDKSKNLKIDDDILMGLVDFLCDFPLVNTCVGGLTSFFNILVIYEAILMRFEAKVH